MSKKKENKKVKYTIEIIKYLLTCPSTIPSTRETQKHLGISQSSVNEIYNYLTKVTLLKKDNNVFHKTILWDNLCSDNEIENTYNRLSFKNDKFIFVFKKWALMGLDIEFEKMHPIEIMMLVYLNFSSVEKSVFFAENKKVNIIKKWISNEISLKLFWYEINDIKDY